MEHQGEIVKSNSSQLEQWIFDYYTDDTDYIKLGLWESIFHPLSTHPPLFEPNMPLSLIHQFLFVLCVLNFKPQACQ